MDASTASGPRGPEDSQTSEPIRGADSGAVEAGSEPLRYEGLPWTPDPMGLERVVARSQLAPIVYVVDAAGEDGGHKLWRAFADAEFVDLTTTPHELLGCFPDVRQAGNRAERLDFALFRQKAQSEGRTAEFVGSDAMADAAGNVPDGSFLEAASFFQAKTKSLKKNANGSWDLALTIDGELPRWLLDSALGETLSVGAVPMGHETDPNGAEARKRVEDAMRRITLRPTEGEFQEFVLRHYDSWGLVAAASRTNSDAIAEAVLETVLRLIGAPSRTMLKTDIDAIERWEALDREYYVNMAMAKGVYRNRRPVLQPEPRCGLVGGEGRPSRAR